MRDQVFISYSHRDEKWLQKLHTHLKPFERTNKIQVWDDTRIESGTRWMGEIESALKAAKVAVLLVSPDYLASDFIADRELQLLFDAAEREGLKVIWVALSASAYTETGIKDYQAANDPTKPLDSLKPAKLNEALVKICEAIKQAAGITADNSEPGCEQSTQTERPKAKAAPPRHEVAPPPTVLPQPTVLPPASHTLPADENARAASRPNRRLPLALGGLAVAVALGGIFAYSRFKTEPPPPPKTISTVEFDDEFLNLEKWTPPPSGWSINTGEGQGRLEINNQPKVGFASDVVYEDFTASFNLKLLNKGGAAWVLRVNGPDDYYLFYLSGPDGMYPNRFLSYVVRGGKPDPKSERSTNVVAELKEGQFYQVEIKAEKNKITHTLTPAETGEEIRLGDFVDPNDTYPSGSVGFRTVAGERFSIDEIWVRPPGVLLPQ